MSSIGWQVVLAIDERERQEDERLERLHWQTYSDRLTPEEIEAVRAGNRATFSRPVAPPWPKDTWLDAGPKMRVCIGNVRFIRRGVYLIVLSKIEDFRGGGRLTNRPLRELQAEESSTIDPISAYEPEPEKVPAHIVSNLKATIQARARYAEHHSERTERELRRSLVEEIRTSRFTATELEQLRAFAEALREARMAA